MSDSSNDPASLSHDRRVRLRREADAGKDAVVRLMSQIPEAMLCYDREWRITYANAEAVRISRIQPSDIGTRTHWEIFPETIGTELEHAYRTVMESGVSQQVEYFYPPFDVWAEIHLLPTEEGIALYYRDITARKRAEAERDAAVGQVRQVLDSSPDSIVCIDHDWKCSFANRAALEILKADALVGEDLWERFPSNREEPFRSNYIKAMEQRVATEFEAYYPEPLDIWFKVVARPFEDGIVIFASDITDRKRAEILRDTAASQLRRVLETTRDGVVTIDRNWNFSFVNPRAAELLSPKGNILGANLWERFPVADQSSDLVYHYHRAMDEGVPGEFEFFYPENLNLWLSVQVRPFDEGIAVFFRDVTARRWSDQILMEQQDLLASVQQAARVATWEVDYATGNVTFGPGSYPVFGHPLRAISHFGAFKKILVPAYLPVIAECLKAALATGEMIVQEFQVRAADGGLLWLESRGQAVFVDGRPSRIRGMTIDIGQRKKNEEALVASEARYRVLADLNPQAIWMGSADGSITYANQGFLDYIGLTLDSISGLGWLNAFDERDRNRVLDAWMRSVATGEEYNVEVRMIRASDGASRWWWLRGQAVRDESGKILNWLGVAIDIDDSKTFARTLQQRQEETERQRAELETIYQTAPIGLALFDPVEFRYLRLNGRQAEILGLPPGQVLGRTLTEIAPIKGLQEMFEQVVAGNPIRNQLLEGELPSRPGEHRFFNVNYFPVYNSEGEIQAITAASLEITQQKKAEAALIQSEKLAAVGRLASSISHEINNPLEAITNLLYLIDLSGELPENLKPYVRTAQDELGRVSQIVTQTLRFHRQAFRATRVNAADLVDSVLTLYQGRLANSNIRVDTSYATSTTVLCFENDMRQVLNNLIANAIDAMRHSGGRLIVRAHDTTFRSASQPQERRGIRITIADTGHGMSKTVQSHLFEPFYTTKDLNGTGLGLWISAGIVSRHQGGLTFRSSEHPIHHGTIFSLFLPWAEVADEKGG